MLKPKLIAHHITNTILPSYVKALCNKKWCGCKKNHQKKKKNDWLYNQSLTCKIDLLRYVTQCEQLIRYHRRANIQLKDGITVIYVSMLRFRVL